MKSIRLAILGILGLASGAGAEPPLVTYVFPAGGQRGTTVEVHVGGCYLHETTPWEVLGEGVTIDPQLRLLPKTLFFEGPVIPLPDSQRSEDYPRDHLGRITLAADAPLGVRYCRAWNSQGATAARKFIVGDLPEVVEQEIDGEPIPVAVVWPVTINGRMFPREDVDLWEFTVRAGQRLRVRADALNLGSPLDPRIEVLSPQGRSLGEALAGPEGYAALEFTAADSGPHRVRIHDIAFGGLQNYVYRLSIDDAEKSANRGERRQPANAEQGPQGLGGGQDFRLTLASDAITVERGGQAKFKVAVERLGGFEGPIRLEFDGLPQGVTVKGAEIAARRPQADLILAADAAARIQTHHVTIRGTADLDGTPATRTAFTSDLQGQPELSDLLLAVALPTPFKITADFEHKIVLRGSVHSRHYRLERGGYSGPLEVRLADRQGRHLQGVTGPTILVPSGVDEFDYRVNYPAWMELGRTTRAQVMATGTVQDADGTSHQVCYTSNAQEVQIIGRTSPGLLSVQAERPSVLAAPRTTARVRLHVTRASEIVSPVKLELIAPDHMRGLAAEAAMIPAGDSTGTLEIHFGDAPGPCNMPVVIRASGRDAAGALFWAETRLDVVAAP